MPWVQPLSVHRILGLRILLMRGLLQWLLSDRASYNMHLHFM